MDFHMNPWIKRLLWAVAGLALLAAAAVWTGTTLADRKRQRRVEVPVAPVALPTGAAGIERGAYLYRSRGCADCHGLDGAGRAFIDDPGGFYAKGPNISPGRGSVVANYSVQDWVRTIRHGVKPDGRPAFIMPSEDYNRLSDEDLGALLAYMKQMPPADGEGFVARVPVPVKLIYAAGLLRDAAEKIDHALPPVATAASDGSLQHGAYVANMCMGCHGPALAGGRIPGAPPDWPAAANLTSAPGNGMLPYASVEQFVAMLRTGKRPDGSVVSPVMPFQALKEMNDADARALYLHLKQLAPVPGGS
jgi:mono/diheme cytochrome c family protein